MKNLIIAVIFIFLTSSSVQAFNLRSFAPSLKLSTKEKAKVDGTASIRTLSYGNASLVVKIYNGSSHVLTGMTVTVSCGKKDDKWGIVFDGKDKTYTREFKEYSIDKLGIGNIGFSIIPCAKGEDFSWSMDEVRGMKF